MFTDGIFMFSFNYYVDGVLGENVNIPADDMYMAFERMVKWCRVVGTWPDRIEIVRSVMR